MNVENDATSSTMSMRTLFAAVVFSELDLDDTIDMKAIRFCRSCMNSNHLPSQCEQVKDPIALNNVRNKNYTKWRSKQS